MARGKACSQRAPGSGGFQRDRHGVSPVIGTILVLFIVVVAVAGILFWGVPAIQGIQGHAEFQSVLNQFLELNSDLKNLRDPQSTRLDTINVNRGTISVVAGSRWVVMGTNQEAWTGFKLTGWESSGAVNVGFTGSGPGAITYALDRFTGANPVVVSTCAASPCLLNGNSIASGAYRLQAKEGTTVRAEAWIFNVGRIQYNLDPSSTLNRVHLEMGAVVTQQGAALFMEDGPLIKDPDYTVTPLDTQYFFRALELQGSTSVSGKGRFPVVVNLVDNFGPNRNRPRIDDAMAVRIQVDDGRAATTPGLLEEAFCTYLDAQPFVTQEGGACSAGDVNLLFDPDNGALFNFGKFAFELSHSQVSALVRGS